MGTGRKKVKATRTARLLERSATCPERLAWNSDQLALVGTASDAAVARMLGVGPSSVEAKRWRLGISPAGQPNSEKKYKFSRRQLALLGKLPDAEVARRMNISLDAVIWRRRSLGIQSSNPSRPRRLWTEKELRLIGRMPDATLAKQLGVTRRMVALKRAELGLPNYRTTVVRKTS